MQGTYQKDYHAREKYKIEGKEKKVLRIGCERSQGGGMRAKQMEREWYVISVVTEAG